MLRRHLVPHVDLPVAQLDLCDREHERVGRWRGRFGGRGRELRHKLHQVDLAVVEAREVEFDSFDRNGPDVRLAADRVERGDCDTQRRQPEHRRARLVLDHDLRQRDVARQRERLRLVPGRRERERQQSVELTRGELELQGYRRVVDVLRELQRVEVDLEGRLVRVLERLRLAGELERGVVDLRRQQRLDVDLGVRRDGRDERNADADVGHRMLVLLRSVVEVDRPSASSMLYRATFGGGPSLFGFASASSIRSWKL